MARARILWYSATSGVHTRHVDAVDVWAAFISGGGGGMGSRPNMSFSLPNDPPYGLYGGKGGFSAVDTQAAFTATASDGETFSKTAHGLVADQPMFVTGFQAAPMFVHGPSLTANTFKMSPYPYTAPGVTTPYNAHNWGSSQTFEWNPYLYPVMGGNGGGIIGDQAIPGVPIICAGGFQSESPYPSSFYLSGECGHNQQGVGGAGGVSPLGGGAAEQIGASAGNAGNNIQGGGGGGAGFLNSLGGYPLDQYGPGGGAGGTLGVVNLPLKSSYFFHAGAGGAAGAAGSGGYAGGVGGNGVVLFIEFF